MSVAGSDVRGEKDVEIFSAALVHCRLIDAKAVPERRVRRSTRAHRRVFECFGGAPERLMFPGNIIMLQGCLRSSGFREFSRGARRSNRRAAKRRRT